MKKKLKRSKADDCMKVWKKRIAAIKGITEKRAEKVAQNNIELIERMFYGNAMIAFHKQDGTFCMEEGTLVGYEKYFHREYDITTRQTSIVYWSQKQHGWRRFMIENLIEWKAIV